MEISTGFYFSFKKQYDLLSQEETDVALDYKHSRYVISWVSIAQTEIRTAGNQNNSMVLLWRFTLNEFLGKNYNFHHQSEDNDKKTRSVWH